MVLIAQLARGQRYADRKKLSATGTMRRSPPVPIDVLIDDLSTTGFYITTDVPLSIDERITIGISGTGRHDAVVVRVATDGFGCEFVQPIAATMLASAGSTTTLQISTGGEHPIDPAVIAHWSAVNDPIVTKMTARDRLVIIAALAAASWGLVYAAAALL